jgi:hypothetical protein
MSKLKLKKKIYIMSDGRIYFLNTVPFFDTSSILLNLLDNFLKIKK